MTQSLFDPTSDPERSGSAFTPPDAGQISQLPDEFVSPPAARTAGKVDFEPAAGKPAIDVSSDSDGKLLLVRLTGKLHKHDYQQFVPIVERAVREHGKIRMLVEMRNFHGWDAGALWEDVKFDVRHFSDIERLAIIGDSRWEKLMAGFCTPFTTATIRYFPSEQMSEARSWITQP